MSIFHLDFETSSEADISFGAYRYASDSSTRILMFAIAEDDGDPILWCFDDPYSEESTMAEAMLRKAVDSDSLVYAHNAQFEVAISAYRLEADIGVNPPALENWRCTLAMCRRAAAPESLAAAAEFFGLGDRKSPVGKALIGVFSDRSSSIALVPPAGMKDPESIKPLKNGKFTAGKKPNNQRSASPIFDEPVLWDWELKVAGEMMTVKSAWDMFCSYCKQDVRVEQALHRKLKHFELRGDTLDSFTFDLKMNWRGIPVNVAALSYAETLVTHFQNKLAVQFERVCGFQHTQRAVFLEWLKPKGYPKDDLQAASVADVLADPPSGMTPLALTALKLRSLVTFSALAKIPTMRGAACADGYVRGVQQWHAARTGRAGGRIIQPHNLRKATINDSQLCYSLICGQWDAVWFEDLWESPLEAIASSIRHFIQPHAGGFFDCDFSSVENKLLAWVVGDEEELVRILDGVDMYKFMAVNLFGVPYEAVSKDQRTIAKPVVLGCGYGVGGRALQTALADLHKVYKTRKECDEYVKIYRDTHPATVAAWRGLEAAAKEAVRTPGTEFEALDGKVSFVCGRAAGIPYLTFRLPSGRRMYYPHPKVKSIFKKYDEEDMLENPWKRVQGGYWIDELSYYGKLQGKAIWGRIGTWGSRLLENLCQAMGADLLNHGCMEAEKDGFDIRLIVHDQILGMQNERPVEELVEKFCSKPEWAATFPQAATGGVTPFYLKD